MVRSPKFPSWFAVTCLGVACALTSSAGDAEAGVIINITEVGADVVASASGSFNVNELLFLAPLPVSATVNPGAGHLFLVAADLDIYGLPTPPWSFGLNVTTVPSSFSGSVFGLNSGLGFLGLPVGYTTGTPFNFTATWLGTTFAGVGMTPGTYVWSWGTGANADTLTLNIGGAPVVVPEPSTFALVGLGVAGLAVHIRRRRRARSRA